MELFHYYSHLRHQRAGEADQYQPTSFWIRQVDCDETKLTEVARHLNFYMHYFDRRSPRIMVHEESVPLAAQQPVRHPFGSFPTVVSAQTLDPYLLGLWHSAMDAPDAFRRFLYLYQILEFAAFYFLQEQMFQAVRRTIVSPDCAARPADAARRILDALAEDKSAPDAKLVSVVQALVDPELVWNEIKAARATFAAPFEFEGGFALPSLILAKWELDDWKASWIPKYPDALRKLRNALVHARETRQPSSLAPTRANHERLRPWLGLLSSTAMQVMLFRG